jgi:SAM-dependent methyltransferase
MSAPITAQEVRRRLDEMGPEIPWAHYFEIAGVPTVSPERDEKFYRKAQGVNRLADLALHLTRAFGRNRGPAGLRVLDIASGEGALSIAFAKAGARDVVGIEGRDLYVARSRFVAEALEAPAAKFEQGDVRKISIDRYGSFDLALCFGILHHLGQDDFLPFLKSVADVTKDMLILYTHVSTPEAVRDFSLKGPVTVADSYQGYLFREHPEGATEQQKIDQVRASLDNTFSFWATDESLMRALKRVGFETIVKVYEPHVFGDYANRNFREIIVAKKAA